MRIDNSFEMRIEIYSPAYMFKDGGRRPEILFGNKKIERGGLTPYVLGGQTEDIASMKLMRPSSVTHVTDVEQRSIDLPITKRTADSIEVKIPENPNLVPSGWYMTFAVNKDGIPSKAYWVQVK